ncbi:hypothetical protein SAMN04489740_0212 [Arthrobacter alpinus]|uniref:Uncharacterized protein n=1 Tax=Arthrobacter alpinus TaxID=656366 RepID=A0A1H5ED05_9MICC|nr:hypothetical protein SAMN04489740_0212 [Arthrobacter alpinus]
MTKLGKQRRSAVVKLGGYRPALGGEVPKNIGRAIAQAVLREVESANRMHPGASNTDFTSAIHQISSTLAEVVVAYAPQHLSSSNHKVVDCPACIHEIAIPVAALEREAATAGCAPALAGGWL